MDREWFLVQADLHYQGKLRVVCRLFGPITRSTCIHLHFGHALKRRKRCVQNGWSLVPTELCAAGQATSDSSLWAVDINECRRHLYVLLHAGQGRGWARRKGSWLGLADYLPARLYREQKKWQSIWRDHCELHPLHQEDLGAWLRRINLAPRNRANRLPPHPSRRWQHDNDT